MDRLDIQADLNTRASFLVKERSDIRERLLQIDRELGDCLSAARLYGVELDPQFHLTDLMTVKAVVLRQLREAGAAGVRVKDLRAHFKDGLHEKTIGMTLYRLSQDGLCKRIDGRTWVLTDALDEAGQRA